MSPFHAQDELDSEVEGVGFIALVVLGIIVFSAVMVIIL